MYRSCICSCIDHVFDHVFTMCGVWKLSKLFGLLENNLDCAGLENNVTVWALENNLDCAGFGK